MLVDEALDFVGLRDYRTYRPAKLSGGLLRRLNIACGIAHKPDLIFSTSRPWPSIHKAAMRFSKVSNDLTAKARR